MIKKIFIATLLMFTLSSTMIGETDTKLEAKFSLRSSSSSSGGGFKSFKSSNSSSNSTAGTFRSRTEKRNNTINRTQNSVNNRSRNSSNSRSNGSFFQRHPILGGIMGGFIGSSISRMLFGGNSGYNNGGYSDGGFSFSGFIINILFIILIIWGIRKLFRAFSNGGSSMGGYSNNSYGNNDDVYDNNQDFDNQKLDLTRDDAKNYINDMSSLSSDEKLNHINKIDSMTNESQIVDYVESVERSNDEKSSSNNNPSVDDAIKQGEEYVNTKMDWLDDSQKKELLSKLKSAKSEKEVEDIIAPLDRD